MDIYKPLLIGVRNEEIQGESIVTVQKYASIGQENEEFLVGLKNLFQSIGIVVSDETPKWRKYLTVAMTAALWIMLFAALENIIFNATYSGLHFYAIGILIWAFFSCCSYSIIAYKMLRGENIFQFLKLLVNFESNFETLHLGQPKTEYRKFLLERRCSIWLLICMLMVIVNLATGSLIFGALNLIGDIFYLGENAYIGVLFMPFILVAQFAVPIPMIIVYLSSYLVENRILNMILFVESEIAHNINIAELMNWYDDMYYLNKTLSNGVSAFVTSIILNTFPNVIFLMQVCSAGRQYYFDH